MSKFSKIGITQREMDYGLTRQQKYEIFQGIVMPIAIAKEKEAKEKGEELPVAPIKMAENMLRALIVKYGKMNNEEKRAFRSLARQKYQEVLNA